MTTTKSGLFSQLRILFDREDAWHAAGLLCMMVIGSLLEMIAVALLFPLIETLANPEVKPAMPIAVAIYRLAAPSSHVSFSFWLLTFLVIFYAAKNLYFALLFYLQNRFGFHKQSKLSERLFAHYLDLPYSFHLQRNTADLLRNLTHETDQVVWAVMIPGLTLVTEALVAISLVSLLFYSSFQPAIVISSVFGITGFFYYHFFRESLSRWGDARMRHDALRIRAIHEGLGSIKELKVLGRRKYFLERHAFNNAQRAQYASRYNLVQNSNLLLLEVLGISSLLILMGLHLSQGKPFESILPLMGVFAGSAFRLIPATNRIINNFQHVQYARPVMRLLCAELATEKAVAAEEASRTKVTFSREVALDDLTFCYSSNGRQILNHVSLRIERGATVGLIGASGAGKTTLVDILLGILAPTSGAIKVDGEAIEQPISSWQALIGYVPQNVYLVDGTIRQNVAFAVRDDEICDDRVREVLREAQLYDHVATLPEGIYSEIGELGKKMSGGQRQRLGIARALYHNPKLLVLDEATSSLDTETEKEVISAIHRMHGQKTVLIITHRLTTLDGCDHIYRLEDGHLHSEVQISP